MKRNRKKGDEAVEAAGTDPQEAPRDDTAANESTAPTNESEATPADGLTEDGTTEDGTTEPDVDPLTRLTQERDQLERQLQRTLADLQNFRKRRVQEMANARRASIEALVGEMLPVLDNFHLALDYESPEDGTATQSMREGLIMVRSLLEGVFERHGVTEIQAAGASFDPAVHEAVGVDPDPDAVEGVITKVIQRGYSIDGRILRPTRVMVGGAPQTTGDDQES
jgi:molecular chaperone GrpE